MGDKLGVPAATVSQIEKGQRALKKPKIVPWAEALGVSVSDLNELWMLCQGLIPSGESHAVFYSDQPEILDSIVLGDDVEKVLREHAELELIYRLSTRICAVMRRVLPCEKFDVQPRKFQDPIPTDLEDWGREGDAESNFVPLPVIWVLWHDPDAPDPVAAVTVPFVKQPTPVVRRRTTSVPSADLGNLIRTLSGAERQRVRGYIDAVIEERPRRES